MSDPSSIDALIDLDERGERERQQARIHSFLLTHDPMTSAEYYALTGMSAGRKALTQSRARVTELYYAGMLAKLERRVCSVTGRVVTVWKALPPPWTPNESPDTRELLQQHLKEALREVARLKTQVCELQAELRTCHFG